MSGRFVIRDRLDSHAYTAFVALNLAGTGWRLPDGTGWDWCSRENATEFSADRGVEVILLIRAMHLDFVNTDLELVPT